MGAVKRISVDDWAWLAESWRKRVASGQVELSARDAAREKASRRGGGGQLAGFEERYGDGGVAKRRDELEAALDDPSFPYQSAKGIRDVLVRARLEWSRELAHAVDARKQRTVLEQDVKTRAEEYRRVKALFRSLVRNLTPSRPTAIGWLPPVWKIHEKPLRSAANALYVALLEAYPALCLTEAYRGIRPGNHIAAFDGSVIRRRAAGNPAATVVKRARNELARLGVSKPTIGELLRAVGLLPLAPPAATHR